MKRRPPFITLMLIVVTVLLTAASGPIGSAIEFPSSFKPFILPLFLILTFVLILIAVFQYFLQQEKTGVSASPLDQQKRRRLLVRVHQFWIKGVLDKSLHGAALIALGLQNQPDVLANPWRLVLQQQNQWAHSLPAGTRIIQIYDETLGELLILGEPGCGKTTLLLELARDLLSRAEKDESLPIPMVFPLSSWAVKHQALDDWLVEEMNTKYQIPPRLARALMSAGQILPLLDGLDEVAAPYRDACVACINAFRREHGLVPVVVCSRNADYLALKQRLLLDTAVVVQPLTEQQIEEYLSRAGEQMESVHAALNNDPLLREMATTPLMLSIMTLAYRGVSAKDFVASGSLDALRRRLFGDYIMAMLQRRSPQTRYTAEQTISWLTWLARQMMQHNLNEFFLDKLKPDWLPDPRSHFVYNIIVVILIFGAVGGFGSALVAPIPVFGLGGGLLMGLVVCSALLIGLIDGGELDVGLDIRLIIGVILGAIVALAVELGTMFLYGLVAGLVGEKLASFGVMILYVLLGVPVVWMVTGLIGKGNFILRVCFYCLGSMPLNYSRFLDYATERILLREVGGGYIFVHRLLLEYFAALADPSASSIQE